MARLLWRPDAALEAINSIGNNCHHGTGHLEQRSDIGLPQLIIDDAGGGGPGIQQRGDRVQRKCNVAVLLVTANARQMELPHIVFGHGGSIDRDL